MARTRLAILLTTLSSIGACGDGATHGSGSTPTCDDEDGDGFGVGEGCDGPDCNDLVAEIHATAECDDWCGVEARLGCPCDAGEPGTCYLGEPSTLGVGACAAGLATCESGVWGECEGQTLPGEESCNEIDDDCDGDVDDGVLSSCGTCGECGEDCWGPRDACDPWGEARSGRVVETAEGWLTLDGAVASARVIWPWSSGRGDVYRVNTDTARIEGHYWTGPNHGDGGLVGSYASDSPSRSAVDTDGSVLVTNRAYSHVPSVTRIGADPASCPDANRDGFVDTSTGFGDKLAFREDDDWDDECILWHTPVGVEHSVASAIAIHDVVGLDGVLSTRAWIGLFNDEKFLELDAETGAPTGEERLTPGFTPDDAAIDREGRLWTVTSTGPTVGRFDTEDAAGDFETYAVPTDWGLRILVDENDVPWISGIAEVFRWNEGAGTFDAVGLEGHEFGLGGIATDGEGSIWAATFAYSNFVYRIGNGGDHDFEWHTIDTPTDDTYAMACDLGGKCWTFGFWSGMGATISVDDESTEPVLDDCEGMPCLDFAFIQGDLTGLGRRTAIEPTGTWTTVAQGCENGDTDWKTLRVDAIVPVDTAVTVSVRTAGSLPELDGAEWLLLDGIDDVDLDDAFVRADVEDAALLGIQVLLRSNHDSTSAPTLEEVSLVRSCPIAIE